MSDGPQFDRQSALARPRRWVVGVVVSRTRRHLAAALVGCEGNGLGSRVKTFASHQALVPRELRRALARFERRQGMPAGEAAILSAQLAEQQAILLEEFSGAIAPLRERVLAVAIDGPKLWRRRSGLDGCLELSDAARVAELTGFNVVDAFSARDLAQDGRGQPLLPIPHWMLLHDACQQRALVQLGSTIGLTLLPAARDAAGASRVWNCSWRSEGDPEQTAATIAGRLAESNGTAAIDEMIVSGPTALRSAICQSIAERTPAVRLIEIDELGLSASALRAAGVGVLGLLHLDHVPANATTITGARVPRVLGRLTPGSLQSWHRLVHELAQARPSVVTLRSAV